MVNLIKREAIKIAFIYFIISFLWILFSDLILEFLFSRYLDLSRYQTYKGWAFVFATSILIYYLVRREIIRKKDINLLLRKEIERTSLIIENHPTVIWSTNIKGETNYISSNIEWVYGFKAEEIYQRGEDLWINRIHPEDVGMVKESFAKLFKENFEYNVEYRIKHKNGSWIWIHDRAKITKNLKGQRYATGVFMEITEKKNAQIQIKESEIKYRKIFESANDTIFLMKDGEFIDCNVKTLEAFDCSKEDIIGKTPAHFSPEYQPDGMHSIEKYKKMFAEGSKGHAVLFDWKHKRMNGSEFDAEVSLNLLKIQNEELVIAIARDVTKQKNAEIALKESEANFKKLSNLTFEGIIIHKQGIAIDCNLSFTKMLGYDKTEIIGKELIKLMVVEKFHKKVLENISKGYAEPYEIEAINKEGVVFPVELEARNIKIEESGEINRVVAVRDISRRKKSEKEIKKLSSAVEQSANSIIITDLEGKIEFANPKYLKVSGLNTGEVIGKTPSILKSADHSNEHISKLWQNVKSGKNWRGEFLNNDKDGNPFWELVTITPIKDDEGKITNLLSLSENITQRKLAERAFRESEKRFAKVFQRNHAASAIFEFSSQRFVDVNDKFVSEYGYSKEEVIGQTSVEIGLMKLNDFEKLLKILLAKGKYEELETIAYTKSGGKRVVSNSSEIIKLEDKEYIYTTSLDITQRKMTEQSLLDSEHKFRTIVENISDGMVILGKEGDYISVNAAYCKMHGYTFEEVLSLNVKNLLHEDNQLNIDSYFNTILNDGVLNTEMIGCHKDGSKVYELVNARIFDYNKTPAILVISRDISERKKTQQRILKSIINTEEKERARFAKELHDGLGPIFSTVKLYFQWLTETDDPDKRDFIINKGNENIQEAITTLKEISNNLNPHILVNYGLIEAIQIFLDKLSENQEISFNYKTELNERFSEEIEITLYRVLTELINNTLKYADATKVDIKLTKKGKKKMLLLEYADNGKGFDMEEVLNKKHGLGLFNIRNRIESIGGNIIIKTNYNEGMTVAIKMKLDNE